MSSNTHFTIPCAHLNKCENPKCTFAHSLNEFRVMKCKYGQDCRYKNDVCYYAHDETAREVYERCGFDYFPEPVMFTYYPPMWTYYKSTEIEVIPIETPTISTDSLVSLINTSLLMQTISSMTTGM